MAVFGSFEDVQNYLDGLGMFHVDLSLNRMYDALKKLDISCPDESPCADAPKAPYIVQVLGTNGKGSTSSFLAALATAHGLRTGLYTSPHFVTPRERIRIDGHMLDETRWPELANRVHEAASELTYFEFLTVLALLAFVDEKVDFVVLEAGLGGLHDATTAIPAHGSCFAPIDLDHTQVLGETIALIAADKAAAMRSGCFALTGDQPEEAMAVLRQVATEKGARLILAADIAEIAPGTRLGLAGPHQRQNALLALAAYVLAARANHWPVCADATARGLAATHIPGRFQLTAPHDGNPAFILDGAHNTHGLRACKAALDDMGVQPQVVIFSCLGDKDLEHMLPLVRDMTGDALILTPTIQDNERAIDGETLAARLQALGCRTRAMPRLATALTVAAECRSSDAPVLVCGSLYLLGEFFTLRPQYL